MRPAILITTEPALTDRLSSMLDDVARITSVEPRRDSIEQVIRELDPSVVLVDIECHRPAGWSLPDIFKLIRTLGGGGRQAIAVGDGVESRKVLDAMRWGANDYVDSNATIEELRASILTLIQTAPSPAGDGSRSISMVVSGRPNDGESAISMHLAAARAVQEQGDGVVFVDFNLPISEAETAFNLSANYTISDAVKDLVRLDRMLLLSALARDSETGLYFLPLTVSAQPLSLPSANSLIALFDVLSSSFSEVVVNIGCLRHSEIFINLLPLASRLLLVTTQSLSSIRCGSDMLKQIRTSGVGPQMVALAISDYMDDVEPNAADIMKALGVFRSVRLPSSRSLLLNCHNDGVLPLKAYPNSPYVRAVERLMGEIYDLPPTSRKTGLPVSFRGLFQSWLAPIS